MSESVFVSCRKQKYSSHAYRIKKRDFIKHAITRAKYLDFDKIAVLKDKQIENEKGKLVIGLSKKKRKADAYWIHWPVQSHFVLPYEKD